ncbi:hypothetical protein [Chryseobacterium sp.]|uniref:hypothetical protein n=1 Tax=Chryseobacterium sp. TaxID=1871047 RepID=UPI00321B6836
MIQFLLLLLGINFPNNTTNDKQEIISQISIGLSEDFDTGGDTIPVLPPKK